ncbi:MAG: DNA polymerase I [Deltaproteobacteria bacterium]|nr:DNA polymerase I [Deltaproteobacteria bacterium]
MPDKKAKAPTVYLVDGSSYMYRSFFAVRGLQNRNGLPTNAVFGFVNMILKILKTKSPTHMLVAFDTKAPTFRHERYPEYKAKRDVIPEDLVTQIPYIKKFIRLSGISQLELVGFEADDIIGTLSRIATESGGEAVLVSSDKDFFQLLSDRVVMWDTMKDTVLRPEDIKERFGLEPSRVLEVMGLMGDTSDNISGVPGIGEKTAVKLIEEYGSLEDLLKNKESVKQKKIRENLLRCGDQALEAMELMKIRTDVPLDLSIDNLEIDPRNSEALKALYLELDFHSFLEESGSDKSPNHVYRPVTRLEDLKALVERLSSLPVLSVDTETTSQEPMRANLVGISLCGSPREAYYVPLAHSRLAAPEQVGLRDGIECLRPLLEGAKPLKIGHNIKYDAIVLERHGIVLKGIVFDTMVASYLLDPDRHAHSLDKVAWEFLGERVTTYKEVVGSGKNEATFDMVPLETACEYSAEDADVAFRLYALLESELREKSLDTLLKNVEVPLISVLASMEMWGVKIDRPLLRDMSNELSGQLQEIEDRVYELAGSRFNLNSPKQLGVVLFEEMGLNPVKKTQKKTGYSTDMEVLTILAQTQPIAEQILNYRILSKLKSTYVDALPGLVHPETGRLHTSYNQTVTATGRLSSSNPNLQNIPIRGELGNRIRRAFIPEKGCKLLSADYSQIELRVLAHYSKDPVLTEAFKKGRDIHTETACGMFGVDPEGVTPEMRRRAKVVNFGIIYGMQAFGLARELGISRGEAQRFIDAYFQRFAGVKSFLVENLERARKQGYVTTLLDRRRYLPQLTSQNNALRSNAERVATNAPFQGSAADIIKVAMIRMWRILREQKRNTKMILQIHDELVFEVPEDELDALEPIIRTEMETAVDLNVPLIVDVSIGDTWSKRD